MEVGKTDDLRAVIEAIPPRTLAAKLRPLMPAIELRLQLGVHLREIVGALNHSAALGEVKFATLKSYLQRYRARQRAGGRPRVPAAAEAARAHPPALAATAAPVAVTPALLRELRSQPIDLEALADGRSTSKKKRL